MVFASVFLIFAIVGVLGLVLAIIQIVQSSGYPDWAYQQVGTSKFVWQILPIIWIFVCSVAAVVQYLLWIGKRDEVARAASGPPPAGGYGYPPPGYPPPGPPPGAPQ
jgi:hypothetical protein